MIVRQLAVRHGRSALTSSVQYTRRSYASEVTHLHPAARPSSGDHQPEKVIPGHPSEPSSILDQSSLPPTRQTRELAERLASIIHEASSVQGDLNAFVSAKEQLEPTLTPESIDAQSPKISKRNSERLNAFYNARDQQRKLSNLGSSLVNVYEPSDIVRNPPRPDDVTLPMLLANQTHLGHATALWNPGNSSYIFGIREGIHIISLEITLAYLRRAAKVVCEVARRGGIILFVGTRRGQQEMVVNSAKLAQGYHVFDRWISGTITNGQTILQKCAIKVVDSMDREVEEYRDLTRTGNHPVIRPDLVICLNPLENEVCLQECSRYNIPTIGIIDTDSKPTRVTYPIPANDDSLRSTALIAGTLGRAGQEGQELRKQAAKQGDSTIDQRRVDFMLERMRDLASIDVQAAGDKDTQKDV